MPIIPELTGTPGDWKPAAPDIQTAAAPGLALAAGGRSLMEVGNQLGELGLKLKAVRDHDGLNKARLAFAEAQANHAAFRAANPDQETWEGNLAAELGAARQKVAGIEISPGARQSLDIEWQGWHQGALADTRVSAIQHGITRARQNITNLDERYRMAGDYGSSENLYREGVKTGLFLPEEAEAKIIDLAQARKAHGEKQADQQELAAAIDDPVNTLLRLKRRPADMEPLKYERIKAAARGALRENSADVTAAIYDGFATGDVRTEKDIDRLGATLRPAARAALKAELGQMGDAAEKARRASPEYQAAVVGKVSSMLAEYRADSENFDGEFVRMDIMVRSLPEGSAVRTELEKRLAAVRSGQIEAVKTHADAANKALDDAFKAGRFGKINHDAPTARTDRFLNDGLLRDPAKFKALGFSDDQVAQAAVAVDEALRADKQTAEYRKTIDTDPLMVMKVREKEDEVRAQYLQQNWAQRKGKPTASAFELKAAEAIADGVTSFGYSDTALESAQAEQTRRAEERYGRAKTELAAWLKRSPNAKEGEIREEIQRIAGKEAAAAMTATKLAPKPLGRGSAVLELPAPLAPYAATFTAAGAAYGVDPRLLAAISMNESANGTSNAFRNKNNAMGISDENGPTHQESVEVSIEKMARLLGSKTYGPYKNARTLAEVAAEYAPVGAKNDPRKLNGGWLEAVSRNLRALGGDPSAPIK